MSCTDRTEQRCKKVYSTCVSYEKELPEFSELDECVSIEETTEELYNLVGTIREELDLESLEFDCIQISGDKKVKLILQTLINKLCTLNTQITEQSDLITTMQEQILNLQEQNCP